MVSESCGDRGASRGRRTARRALFREHRVPVFGEDAFGRHCVWCMCAIPASSKSRVVLCFAMARDATLGLYVSELSFPRGVRALNSRARYTMRVLMYRWRRGWQCNPAGPSWCSGAVVRVDVAIVQLESLHPWSSRGRPANRWLAWPVHSRHS